MITWKEIFHGRHSRAIVMPEAYQLPTGLTNLVPTITWNLHMKGCQSRMYEHTGCEVGLEGTEEVTYSDRSPVVSAVFSNACWLHTVGGGRECDSSSQQKTPNMTWHFQVVHMLQRLSTPMQYMYIQSLPDCDTLNSTVSRSRGTNPPSITLIKAFCTRKHLHGFNR